MGKLLLCSHSLASVPYYIENMALNIYSLEEMCCYLKQNIDLIEPSFMDGELILWIETELKLPALAKKLEKRKREGCSLGEFVAVLASGCSYCKEEEIRDMQKTLADFEDRSELECRKIRTDRLLQKKRYGAAVAEYRKLLALCGADSILAGNIYHNLGTAYAGLFLFEEAADCYGKAFERNKNPVSDSQKKMALELSMEIRPSAEQERLDGPPQETLWQWKETYLRNCK